MAYHDLSNLNHDRTLAAALGDMVVAWAEAESVLCATLARVTGMNINMCTMGYYRIPTFESRRKYLEALMAEWNAAASGFDKAAIAKEVDAISGLSKARNDWVHGVWCASANKTETVIFDFRRADGNGRRTPVKAAAIQNHVEALNKRVARLSSLISRHLMTGEPPHDAVDI